MKLLQTTCFLCLLLFSMLASAQSNSAIEEPRGPISEIEFESTLFNFGAVETGEVVQTVFSFTNNGDEPLIISNAKGSCGCIVPEWPKAPIRPGESGQFVVRFNSKNKVGIQSKRVTITANTEPANTYLTLTGEVLKVEEEIKDAPAPVVAKTIQKKDYNVADVLLYPNPASDQLSVRIQNNESKANIYLYNASGQLVDSKISSDNTDVTFDISHYNSGIYTVSVKSENLHRIAKQVSIIQD